MVLRKQRSKFAFRFFKRLLARPFKNAVEKKGLHHSIVDGYTVLPGFRTENRYFSLEFQNIKADPPLKLTAYDETTVAN